MYGGSFDPPHVAHVLAAAYALTCGELDRLLVIPTFDHALGKAAAASFEDRVTMVRLAMKSLLDVETCEVEASLPAPSRTLQTLEALAFERPEDSFRLVIGADILREVHLWHRWDEVARRAPPVVVGRQGVAKTETPGATLLPLNLPPVSSSEIRARLARRESTAGLVPGLVRGYIDERGLYR